MSKQRGQAPTWRDTQAGCIRHKAVLRPELVPIDSRAKLRLRPERQCGLMTDGILPNQTFAAGCLKAVRAQMFALERAKKVALLDRSKAGFQSVSLYPRQICNEYKGVRRLRG